MTPEDLDKILKKNDVQACLAFFSDMSEAKRKLLATRADAWLKVVLSVAADAVPVWWTQSASLDRARQTKEESNRLKSELPKQAQDLACVECCRIAVLATANLTEIRKFGEEGVPTPENAFAVLAARKPKWLDKWMKFACKERTFTHWLLIRRMEREGLAELEADSNYWSGMAMGLPQRSEALPSAFDDDLQLCDMLWSMLDDEPTMLLLSGLPNVPSPEGSYDYRSTLGLDTSESRERIFVRAADAWEEAIPHLMAKTTIDKTKLNDSMVYWLNRLGADDQESTTVNLGTRFSWFGAVYASIEKDEKLKRRNLPRIVGLLNAPNRFAIRWAIEKLRSYDAELLPVDDIGAGMASLFRIKGREHAAEAMVLLKHMANSPGVDKKQIAHIALEGLEHSSQEIHKKSLDLIGKLGVADDAGFAMALRERLSCLSGLLRERADKLVKGALTDVAGSNCGGDLEPEQESFDDLGDLESRINLLEESVKELAGINEAVAALKNTAPYVKALSFATYQIPRLNLTTAVTPITDVDDLIFRMIQIIEGNADAETMELVMDGVSRLCDQHEDNLAELFSPLHNRVQQSMASAGWRFLTGGPFSHVITLIAAWSEQRALNVQSPFVDQLVNQSPGDFFALRIQGVVNRVLKRVSRPLLSAPTHKGGWVDPRIMVERQRSYSLDGLGAVDGADFIQALLRCTPDGRVEALRDSRDISGEFGAALRFAFGGDLEGDVTRPELWVAAARARAPECDFDFLSERFSDLGPDSAICARYKRCFVEIQQALASRRTQYDDVACIEITPGPQPRQDRVWFPTELLHQPSYHNNGRRLGSFVWPQFQESLFSVSLQRLAGYLETERFDCSGLEMLLDPDVNASGLMCPLILIGLGAKQFETGQFFEDALVACIEDGRLDGIIIGAAASDHIFDSITQTRWIKAFRNVAKVSPLHNQVIRISIENILAGRSNPDSNPPIKFLELLYELCLDVEEGMVSDAVPAYLSSVAAKGKGKGALLAKQLLKLETGKAMPSRKAAAQYALRSRVQRGERYQSTRRQAQFSPDRLEPVGEQADVRY